MQERIFKKIQNRKIWDTAAVSLSDHLSVFNPTHLVVRDVLDLLCTKELKIFGKNKFFMKD